MPLKVANICDSGYLGIYKTLAGLGPLLQRPRDNPHASLLGVFMNAVMEMVYKLQEQNALPDIKGLLQYLPDPTNIMHMAKPNSADMLRIWDARTLFLDVERYFRE